MLRGEGEAVGDITQSAGDGTADCDEGDARDDLWLVGEAGAGSSCDFIARAEESVGASADTCGEITGDPVVFGALWRVATRRLDPETSAAPTTASAVRRNQCAFGFFGSLLRARVTLARISSAFAVQTNGVGSLL